MKLSFFITFATIFLLETSVAQDDSDDSGPFAELIPPDLMNKTGSRNVMVTLSQPLDNVYQQIGSRTFPSRAAKATAFTGALKEATGTFQLPILSDLISLFSIRAINFWITNQILVPDANSSVIDFLRKQGSVKQVAEEFIFPPWDSTGVPPPTTGAAPNGTEWSVQRIGAEELWAQGIRGQGVIVAVIDSGVRGTHEAIRDNYVGAENNGWRDPINNTTTPMDDNGHGTHCTGTIVGNNGIGVAPDAKWMACKGCTSTGGCVQSALLTCGQFIICPTDPMGNNPDCSKAPHIVSNSWGGVQPFFWLKTWYNDVIRAWNEAGIIPFFCNGNNGPSCQTQWTPGDQPGVISVGATNINDTVSRFSSRGPKTWPNNDGRTVPLIVAPGENINSAYNTADDAYTVMSGCSMATPATAGAAALLLSSRQNGEGLTLEQTEDAMYETTERNLGRTGSNCGNAAEDQYPNDVAGWGRLNVKAAHDRLSGSSS